MRSRRPTRLAAAAAASVLGFVGLLHVYWATGATWPAADAEDLSYAVLGIEASFAPSVVLPLFALESVAAGMVLARARWGRDHRFGLVFHLSTLAIGVGASLRALAGVAWLIGVDVAAPADSAFHWLNPIIYTPLCVLLATAVFTVARSKE